ncbi:MAG: PAS domain S-box protein, partial [Anaerolineae bacterium]|nr:PAS domain S-box protein [Anaerolineae bacterium]
MPTMLTLLDFRVRQRDFLLEISRAITAQLDLSEVLKRVLNASVAMLGGQIGIIALRDASGVYRVRATIGVDAMRVAEIDADLAQIFDEDAALDYKTMESRLKQIAESLDKRMKQTFALPLGFAGEPMGVLVVFRAYLASATPDDVQVLQSFADQAAIAVHNAQLYARIEHERRRLAAILQHSADGVLIVDARGVVQSINTALERMTGWLSADAVGRDHDEVIVWRKREGRDLKQSLAEGWWSRGSTTAAQETLYAEGDLERRDGLTLSVGIIYAPLFNAEGHLVSIVADVRDITNFRQAQEMQSTFISMISHELRTPVALIKGNAATLRRDDVEWDVPTVRDLAGVIEEESDRLSILINNLLTTSKMQAQRKIELDIDDVRLDYIAARTVERFQPQTRIHSLKLNFPHDFPTVRGDEQRLTQVFDNLISNAIKYSPNGGVIEIGGRVDADSATVYVRDQGVGLSEADLTRVFERFYRVDGALSRRTQGTGLGLYLARQILVAHGGDIRVESQPGKGSTFYFTLP